MGNDKIIVEVWRQKTLDSDVVNLRCRIPEIKLSVPLNESFSEQVPKELLIDSAQDILRDLIERLEEYRG